MNNPPRLILRRSNIIDMSMIRVPNVTKYRFRGQNTLDGAFAASVPMFEAISGLHYRSKSLRASGLGYVEDIKRGYTRITINPNDFASIPMIPPGEDTLYLRVEEYNSVLGAYNPPGPITVFPPEEVYNKLNSGFAIYGTAPNSVLAAAGHIPTHDVMVINMSFYSSYLSLRNLSSSVDMLMSMSEGGPMITVPAEGGLDLRDCAGDMLYLCSVAPMNGTANFSIVFSGG